MQFTIGGTEIASGTAKDRLIKRPMPEPGWDFEWVTATTTLLEPPVYVALEGEYDGGTNFATGTMSVVPEPASMLLFGSAMAGAVAAFRRNRKG